MAFLKKAAGFLAGGLIGGLLGLRSKKKEVIQPKAVTRDDAAREAARDEELMKRRGASADRIVSGGEPAGGIGRLIVGS
jgi:hypothetical protein